MTAAVDRRLTLLPPTMRPLGERVGVDATVAFMEAFGGLRFYVPKRPLAKSKVWKHDRDTARALSEIYGGQIVVVPLGTELERAEARARRDRAIREDPRSDSVVANEWRLSRRTVEKIRAGVRRADDRQAELFG